MNKKILFIFLLLFMIRQYSFSQNQQLVDSLEHELKNIEAFKKENGNKNPAMSDTTEALILYQLSNLYWGNNPDTALFYAEQCLSISENSGFKKGIAKAYYSMGIIHSDWGEYPEALQFQEKALAINKEAGIKSGIADSYNEIGLTHYYMGNNPEALKNYLSSISINEALGNKQAAAGTYMNMGNVYANIKNYNEALKMHKLSLNAFNATGFKRGIAMAYNNMGIVFSKQTKYDEALKSYQASLKIKTELGDKKGIANAGNNIASTYTMLGNYSEALKTFVATLKLQEDIGDKNGLSGSYIGMGRTYENMGNLAEAKSMMNKGLELALQTGNKNVIKDGYSALADINAKLNDYKSAYENEKLFKQAYDSVFNDENDKKLTQQQMQFDYDKKAQADSLKFLQEKEISEIKLQKQKAYSYGGFLGIAVTITLLFFVFRNYSKQRIANKKLKETQECLIRREKMAAFGELASRVSHEIQNPLNFVNNFSDLSQDLVKEMFPAEIEKENKQNVEVLLFNLQKINEHGKRAETIVRKLQEHSTKGTALEFFESEKNK